MSFLEKIKEIALPLESNDFYKNNALFLGTIFLLSSGILYYNHSKTTALRADLLKMYGFQKETKTVLERLKEVTKQSEEVNALLEEDKNFKLKSFFDDTVSQLGLSSKQVKEADPTEDILQKNYGEIRLSAQFQSISTQQLCKLLQAIENKARVYTKDLTINKKNGSLDVTLTVATLKIYTNKKG